MKRTNGEKPKLLKKSKIIFYLSREKRKIGSSINISVDSDPYPGLEGLVLFRKKNC